MEKLVFQGKDGDSAEFYVLEQTRMSGVNYLLVTDSFGSYTVHVLSHRTNVIILPLIVMETFGMERVGSITGA